MFLYSTVVIIDLDEVKQLSFESFSVFTLVDGSFDPLHHGHINYFEEALSIGFPVSCLVAPDTYTAKKHRILLEAKHRSIVLNSLRQIDIVFTGNLSTESAVKLLRPKIFFKGGDWRDKLPKSIIEACFEVECEIIFGSKPIESSSSLLGKWDHDR